MRVPKIHSQGVKNLWFSLVGAEEVAVFSKRPELVK